MKKSLLKAVSVILAALVMFSVAGTPVFAAEVEEDIAAADTGAAYEALAESGAEEDALAESGAAAPDTAETGAAAPVITSTVSTKEGVTIHWNAIDGVPHFRIYKWYDDGRGWVKLQDTANLYYTDTTVVSGTTYQYRLVGINSSGSVITPTVTKSVNYVVSSGITGAQAVNDGIRLDWNKLTGVSKIAVYRKENGGWRRITTSSDSTYTDKDVTYGGEYTYTIRELNANGGFLFEDYDHTGVTLHYLKTPTVSVENAAGGVKISWNKIDGAAQYRIFYRNSKGSWTRMATTADTSLLDQEVKSGRSYTYTVRCVAADGETYTSFYDTAGKSVNYIAAPVLLSANSTDKGIQISWQRSDGAAKYRVFYRNSKGNWARLGDTTGASLLDTDVKSGVTYTYTVRCMDSSGAYISSFYSEGVKGTFLSAPVVSVGNGADGVDIKWNEVPGAVNYRVYYYTNTGWIKLTDTTGTAYTYKEAMSGSEYAFTVRCINAEGNAFTSGYNDGKSVYYVAAPTITEIKNTEEGVKITWNAEKGAQKYRVYYYGRNGWTKMTDTASTNYVDKQVSSGTTYTYTVRCVNAAGNAFLSYFKPGVSHKYVAAPDFKLTRNAKSITVSWDTLGGAELYRVYRLEPNGWSKLVDTTETSYEDTAVTSGYTYTYTVRCLNADATAFTSDYLPGKSMKIVDTPVVSSVTGTAEGVEVKWGAVAGAEKYRVYYKTDGGWTKIGETGNSTFVHTDAESGRDYTYTVRCVNALGTVFESSFDSVGKTIHYIAAPSNLKAESVGNTIKISWKHSAGAEKYRVYYYGSKGWTKLTETTDNSCIDSDIVSGYTYRYTVRCITADGSSFTSSFQSPGVSHKFTEVPVLKAADYTKDGIQISWKASKGAEKYRVYTYSNGWKKLTETTETSFEDKSVSSGSTYRYTVRCITSDGTAFTSDCDTTGVKLYFVAAPKMVSADTDSGSATITWSKPNGASYYRVYKRVNGSWKRLTNTSSNSYTDNDVEVGETYTYTVRVMNQSGTEFYSGFDPDGFVVTVVKNTSTQGFVYYDQGQYNYPYGDDTIAYSGCGPTSFAMIASTLLKKTITPIDAVKWCGNSFYVYNVGTMWSYFSEASQHFGITMEKQLGSNEFSKVVDALKQGKYVISAQRAGIFTSGGHFIVLAGITSSGRIIVYDPNGGNHYVGTDFAQSDITASGTQYWVFDK